MIVRQLFTFNQMAELLADEALARRGLYEAEPEETTVMVIFKKGKINALRVEVHTGGNLKGNSP